MPAVTGESKSFRGPEVRRLTAEEFGDAVGSITGEWHVYQPGGSKPGAYTREWRVASSPLSRALGRPIRDQVYSSRDNQATTLQALELVNGEALTHWLNRGSKKLLGQLAPDPVSLFDSTWNKTKPIVPFDVDIKGASKVWLVVQDRGSYSPEKIEAAWVDLEGIGPSDAVRLGPDEPLRVKTPSTHILDIAGKGYRRLRGSVTIENKEITSDLNPQLRFYIFQNEPNLERLTPVSPETPLPQPGVLQSSAAVDRAFWYALGRAPTAGELRVLPKPLTADGLADLLWALLMKPEFQLIY